MRSRYFSYCLLVLLLIVGGRSVPAQVAEQPDGVPRITLAELKALLASATPPFVIDVRSGVNQKIKGAHSIPVGEIEARLNEIPHDREIVTYCS
jgi:rhodanese-related sulfurtransferase